MSTASILSTASIVTALISFSWETKNVLKLFLASLSRTRNGSISLGLTLIILRRRDFGSGEQLSTFKVLDGAC